MRTGGTQSGGGHMLTVESRLEIGEAAASPVVAARRPVRLVIRRRRVLTVLLGTAAALALLGVVPMLQVLWWGAGAAGLLGLGYLALVAGFRRLETKQELVVAFRHDDLTESLDWRALERELHLADRAAEPVAVAVARGERALARFLVSYALGWALIPVVALIRLVRGDLAGLEHNGMMARVVKLQQYGRSQSLRLLTVGAAATVGVTAIGVTASTPASARTSEPIPTLATSARASVPPMAASSAAATTYTVQTGDILSAIAARYGATVDAIAAANRIADPNLIYPGQRFSIPGNSPAAAQPVVVTTYRIQAGDTLSAVAARYGTTVDAIAAANVIGDPNLIYPGQIFTIPSGGPSSPTAAPQPATHLVRTPAVALPAKPATRLIRTVRVVTPLPAKPPAVVAPAKPPVAVVRAKPPALVAHPVPVVTVPVPASGYVNPFRYGSWAPSRIDQGVDWVPTVASPVVAIGNGVITYSSTHSGWPGGGFITYRLTTGSHAGLYVYVAEHLTNLVPVGTLVTAGQVIATALPGYPWTEWGWASPSGPAPAPSARYNGAPDGTPTPGGKAFARFLIELGARVAQDPGPGPDRP